LVSVVGEAARPTRLGRYELITRIGQGGMAEVQLALQRGPAGFEKLVVVKLVHDNLASQKSFVDMLLDEARVAALVKHPNVVDIYDLGQADGRFFIAMEYLEGEPLLAVLRAGRDGKRLDPLSTGRLVADTAEGLDAAHELRSMSGERLELVHHDISLGNIVVLYNGQVKLVDFGVAKATTAAGGSGKVQGKFSYMAPEKLEGAQGDRRSDIFSLGCVMWEALTLKRLFRGGNDAETMKQVLELNIQPPSKVNGDVPPDYDSIVMKALSRRPEQRHDTAKELAVEIEELLRKRGYGAKNDRIAKYMQETFKGHIDARNKLVQEVVSKGSASAEVLDAAFSDQALASGSPITPVPGAPDFSSKYRRVTPAVGVPIDSSPAWADASKPTQLSSTPFDTEPSSISVVTTMSDATVIDIEPLGDHDEALDVAPVARAETANLEPVETSKAGAGMQALLADKQKRLYVAAGAGALLLILVITIVASGGKRATPEQVASAGSARVGSGEVDSASLGSGEVDSANAGSGEVDSANAGSREVDSANAGSREVDSANAGSGDVRSAGADANASRVDKGPVVALPPETKDPRDSKQPRDPGQGKGSNTHGSGSVPVRPPPPPPIDVEKTVQEGLMAFVKGDSKQALVLLQKARTAKPGYAPTYRVLGKVYKKLGDNVNAKKAFQRYLALAPKASDADQIREEIKNL
jgi:eukaryotic-like serine/threonine-protein kinase